MVAQCRWGKECAFLAGFRCRFEHKTSDIAYLSVEVLVKRQLKIERRLCNYIHRSPLTQGLIVGVSAILKHLNIEPRPRSITFCLSYHRVPTPLPLRRPNRYTSPSPTLSLVSHSPGLHLLNLVPL
jgi:hypothetical protein